MRTSVRRLAGLTVLAFSLVTSLVVAAPANAASVRTFEVTVTNLTEGQLFTPPVVATHRRQVAIFEVGAPASPGLQSVAENGGVPDLVAELTGNTHVDAVEVAGAGPLAPGSSVTITMDVSNKGKVLSLASMLICSNDGFAGIDSIKLPRRPGQKITAYGDAYDAGTEINTEDYDDLVPPCDGSGATGMSDPLLAEGGVVMPHAGIVGGADLSPGIHGWTDPVVKITVQRIDRLNEYEVTVTNLTGSQLFTPPVAATHRGTRGIFDVGSAASFGLQQVAENGGVPDLVGELNGNRAVSRVAVGSAGPLAAGDSVTFTILSTRKAFRFSLASMLICSNDGFAGIDSIRLPRHVGDSVMAYGDAYDAGTEVNTEAYADLVPPCDGMGMTGMSDPLLAEGGVVHPHAGIVGGADLSPGVHGWSDPVVEVTIERVG